MMANGESRAGISAVAKLVRRQRNERLGVNNKGLRFEDGKQKLSSSGQYCQRLVPG